MSEQPQQRSEQHRVVILAGGLSHERDVSLRSGRRVADAMRDAGLEVTVRDVDAGLMQWLRSVVANELAQTGAAPTRASMLKRLDAGETITVDGYGISPQFYRDLMGLEWQRLLEVVQCPVLAIDGTNEPPFWRESKRFHSRAPVMSGRTMQWLEEQAA